MRTQGPQAAKLTYVCRAPANPPCMLYLCCAGMKIHPNREAPRCLPCGYQDPLLDVGCPDKYGFIAPPVRLICSSCCWPDGCAGGVAVPSKLWTLLSPQFETSLEPYCSTGHIGICAADASCLTLLDGWTFMFVFHPEASCMSGTCETHLQAHMQACPCTPEALLTGNWTHGDQGVLDRVNYKWQGHGGGDAPHPGWWYMLHGGRCLTASACKLRWGPHASGQEQSLCCWAWKHTQPIMLHVFDCLALIRG